jgi:hypothetical protein
LCEDDGQSLLQYIDTEGQSAAILKHDDLLKQKKIEQNITRFTSCWDHAVTSYELNFANKLQHQTKLLFE